MGGDVTPLLTQYVRGTLKNSQQCPISYIMCYIRCTNNMDSSRRSANSVVVIAAAAAAAVVVVVVVVVFEIVSFCLCFGCLSVCFGAF